MTNQKLKEIRARLDAATPGPWTFSASLFTDARIWIEPLDCGLIIKAESKVLYGKLGEIAHLIANAPTDIAYSLSLIEKQSRAIELIQGQCGIPDAGDACRAILKTIKILSEGE